MDLSLPKKRRKENKQNTPVPEQNEIQTKCEDCSNNKHGRDVEAICVTCEKFFCNPCLNRHTDTYDYHTTFENECIDDKNVAELIELFYKTDIWSDFMTVKQQTRGLLQCKHVRDGNQPWISGITVLNDDKRDCTIAAVDFNNSSIKIINVRNNVIEHYHKLDTKPWDITAINNTTVAVTCPEVKSIKILRIAETIEIISPDLCINVDCQGICFVKDRFYVSSTAPVSVLILDKFGNILRQVDKTENGEVMFGWPLYIAVNLKCSSILVSDYFENKVIHMNLQDLSVCPSVYTHVHLQYPRGLVYIDHGSVLLAGRRNIHQLSVHCEHLQVLLENKDGIEWPQSVAYSKKCNLLFIGKHSLNSMSSYISVFHIQ